MDTIKKAARKKKKMVIERSAIIFAKFTAPS